jgi:hypothetical protein
MIALSVVCVLWIVQSIPTSSQVKSALPIVALLVFVLVWALVFMGIVQRASF